MRISRVQGEWKADVVQEPVQQMQYRLDHTGHVLYACIEGYCEISAEELAAGNPAFLLQLHDTKHKPIPTPPMRRHVCGFPDRFGCIWWRGRTPASYQCPSDPEPINLPPSLASLGFPSLFEMADGTIVIPSYGKPTFGRPGNFGRSTGAMAVRTS